jgi:hypothetical protein
MTLGHLLFAATLTLYMGIAALFEERDLVGYFGDQYRAYRRRVPMFIPRLGVGGESRPRRMAFNPRVFADLAWWHWAITIPLLAAHLAGFSWAIWAALGLCAAMALYYLLRFRSPRPIPVQVRLAFLAWLLIGLLPAMRWMYYFALVGITARVIFGYCLLARVLGLFSFNRSAPLNVALLRRQFLSPSDGGLFVREPLLEAAPAISSCATG